MKFLGVHLGFIVSVFVTMLMFPQMQLATGPWPRLQLDIFEDGFPPQQIELVDFVGCSPKQRKMVIQDRIDAQILALASVEPANLTLAEESSDLRYYIKAGGTLTVDWDGDAAKEYWGRFSLDPDAEAHRLRISDTLWRATGTHPNASSAHPLSERRVSIHCFEKQTAASHGPCNKVYAYEHEPPNSPPIITLCPKYFVQLSLDEMNSVYIEEHAFRSNIEIFSLTRASTFLHEGLHIAKGPAKQCYNPVHPQEGCDDHVIPLKDRLRKAYGSGMAKLLANMDPLRASVNNDNYVSFAVAKYLEKRFGVYPKYPSAYSANRTYLGNLYRGMKEHGISDLFQGVHNVANAPTIYDVTKYLRRMATRSDRNKPI